LRYREPKSHYGPFFAKMAAKTTSVSGFHFRYELLALDFIITAKAALVGGD